MTPAQQLEAAKTEIARRRIVAEHASPGPWIATTWGVRTVDSESMVIEDGDARTGDLGHIASNDPKHVLAVLDMHAELLDACDEWMLQRLARGRAAVVPNAMRRLLDMYAPVGVHA